MFLNLGHSANQGTDAARVTNPLAHLAADHTEVSLTDIDVIEATTSSQQRKQHDPNQEDQASTTPTQAGSGRP